MKKIFVSFSGGRSSALMCKIVLEKYPDSEKVFVFANTGEEHPKTLDFVHQVDQHLGLNLVWVEAQVERAGKGCTHRIVNYETASRKGEPFEAVISKYGIPNKSYSHCTREMKLNPMYSYLDSIGWKRGDYFIAIGIRADEPKRIQKTAEKKKIFYPLVDAGIDKQDVLDFWESMPFNLEIPEHYGNCKTCWKKSDKKHVMLIKEHPEWYDFFSRMEKEYGLVKGLRQNDTGSRTFFRMKRSVSDMIALAQAVEKPNLLELNRPDENSGCSESCEVTFDDQE
jgi:3'-phosphoadenosine 5'-phosphosulfate sulfotransferase (PAPS reductase)/FAD synthetase